MAAAKILVVEDEPMIRKIIAFKMGKEGHEVIACQTAGEALAACQREPPDLILLDVTLPDQDGFWVVEALRKTGRSAGIPIILMTVFQEAEQTARGKALGVAECLEKPFKPTHLARLVRNLLGREGAADPQTPAHPEPSANPEASPPAS